MAAIPLELTVDDGGIVKQARYVTPKHYRIVSDGILFNTTVTHIPTGASLPVSIVTFTVSTDGNMPQVTITIPLLCCELDIHVPGEDRADG